MPGFAQAVAHAPRPGHVADLGDPLGCGDVRPLETYLPRSKVPVWFVDCPSLYGRDGGPYQDVNGTDRRDNHLRFALLNHVAAGVLTIHNLAYQGNFESDTFDQLGLLAESYFDAEFYGGISFLKAGLC